MANLKSGTLIGGNMIWHAGNVPLDYTNGRFYIDGKLIYTSTDKPSAADVGAVSKTGDTMTGILNAPRFSLSSATGTSYIIGGGDGASSTVSNLILRSWYGIGFSPTISGQPIPEGENAVYINVRNGTLTARGTITAPTFSGALSGNASSATKLATARSLTIGNTAKNFDGSANVAWSVSEIGAVNKAGDTMTGDLTLTNDARVKFTDKIGLAKVNNDLYTYAQEGVVFLEGKTHPVAVINGVGYNIYHGGNKPSAADVGAASGGYAFTLPTGDINTALRNNSGFFNYSNATNRPSWPVSGAHTWDYYFNAAHSNTAGYNGVIAMDFNGKGIAFKAISNGADMGWKYVYHTGYKPTAADVGAVNKAGDTMTGTLRGTQFTISGRGSLSQTAPNGESLQNSSIRLDSVLNLWIDAVDGVYAGTNFGHSINAGWHKPNTAVGSSFLRITKDPAQFALITSDSGSTNPNQYTYRIYHQGYKPTPDDITAFPALVRSGALATDPATWANNPQSGIYTRTISGASATTILFNNTAGSARTIGFTGRYTGQLEYHTNTDANRWLTYTVYTSGNKPTAADVGALPLTGGTLTGAVVSNSTIQLPGYGGRQLSIGATSDFGSNAFALGVALPSGTSGWGFGITNAGNRIFGVDTVGITHLVGVNATGTAAGQGICYNGKTAIGGANDGWLRFNPHNQFSNGIYCNNSVLRTDGSIQVGGWGSNRTSRIITAGDDVAWGQGSHAAFGVIQNNTSGAHWLIASHRDSSTIRAGIQVLSADSGMMRFYTNNKSKYVDIFDGHIRTQHNVIVGGRIVAGYDPGYDNAIGCSNWFRSSGNTGWYNATHGGGIYMTDSTWVRVSHNKKFIVENTDGDSIQTTGGAYLAGNLNANDVYIRSDIRLKSNLMPIENALNKIITLTGYSYDKKRAFDSNEIIGRELGIIAQDLKKIAPEAVSGDDLLTISNSSVNALIIEAIKELNTKIEYLISKIKE